MRGANSLEKTLMLGETEGRRRSRWQRMRISDNFFFSNISICCYPFSSGHCFSSVFPPGSGGKESACNAGDLGSVPGLGRSPGEGKDYPCQNTGLYSGLRIPWGCKELDMTERLSLSFSNFYVILLFSYNFYFLN